MRQGVFLGTAAAALHDFLRLGLQLLQLTCILDAGQVSPQQGVHIFETGDLLVTQASRADADTQAEGTEPVFSDALVGVCIFEATEAVLAAADVLVIWIGGRVRILA